MSALIRFTTASLRPESRLPYFTAATTDFTIEAIDDPLDFTAASLTIQLGPLVISRFELSPFRCRRDADRIDADGRDHFSISFLLDGVTETELDGISARYVAGDALVLDLSRTMMTTTRAGTKAIVVLVPRALVEEVLPNLTVHGPIASSPAVALARDHVSRLLEQPPDIDDEAVITLHVRALRDTLAAMMMPFYRSDPLEQRRNAALLKRAIAHIDGSLTSDLDSAGLCVALGASRSTLYRALQPVGGIKTLILRRRLSAARRRLVDPSDARTIAAIASASGFCDMSQFSRQFRRAVGKTPGSVRSLASVRPGTTSTDKTDWLHRYQMLIEAISKYDN